MAGNFFIDQSSVQDFVDQNTVSQFVDQDGDFLGTSIFSGISCDAGSYALTGSSAALTSSGGPSTLTALAGSYTLTGSSAALTSGSGAGAIAVLMPAGCM